MKTIHIIRTSLTAAWLAFCTTATAQQLVGGKVSLLNKEVKKQGNNVKVGMDLKLDNLQLKSNQGIVLIPMIVNRDDTLQMPAMEIMGRKRYIYYQRNQKTATFAPLIVEKRKNGEPQNIHYIYSTPYCQWMNNSQLVIGQDVCGCNQAIVEEGLLSTVGDILPTPVAPPKPVEKPRPPKIWQEKGSARLNFNINKAFINTKLNNNDAELDKICRTIDRVKNNPNVRIVSITLHGYASPDGNYENNKRLAEARTKTVYDHLIGIYPVEKHLFEFSSTAEDWQGVRNYVESHDIPQKNIVLDIINSDMTPDEKEQAIAKKAGNAHRFLIKEVYPQLRRTEYSVNYEIKETPHK